jgi:NTE family protein
MTDEGGVGLVLAGGGARGAYELGVLSVLLPFLEERGGRPSVLVGTSVGAINAAGITATSHLPASQTVSQELARWREVDRGAVIRPVLTHLPIKLARYAGEVLSLPGVRLTDLLDPSPLRRNLGRWIDWARLHESLTGGQVHRLAVVATAAHTGRAVAFVEGKNSPALPSS